MSSRAPSYAEYLQLPALLGLQRPLGTPAVHDEMLFIIVHQTHELWFKQLLWELGLAIGSVDGARWREAYHALDRVTRIVRLLGEHIGVLETMSADAFEGFRASLGTASGLESEQFRRLERVAGMVAMPRPLALLLGADRGTSTTLRQAFWRSVAAVRPESAVAQGERDVGSLGAELAAWLAEPELEPQRGLARAMFAFDRQLVLWRRQHFEMARQMIGGQPGTGGSSGATYLRATMDRRFFPELWP